MPPKKRNPLHHHRPTLFEEPLPIPSIVPQEYNPPPASIYDAGDWEAKRNRLNNKTYLHGYIVHPQDAILEYPETTTSRNLRIAHIIPVDPQSFRNPISSVQYSMRETGGIENVKCRLLVDTSVPNDPQYARCYKITTECKPKVVLFTVKAHLIFFYLGNGTKLCDYLDQTLSRPIHTFVTPQGLRANDHNPPPQITAEREVFERTLALYCSLVADGCHGPSSAQTKTGPESEMVDDLSDSEGSSDGEIPSFSRASTVRPMETDSENRDASTSDPRLLYRPSRSKRPLGCPGKILLQTEKQTGKHFLRYRHHYYAVHYADRIA